jgi:peptidyl-prolyl cis-trans isomerase SurA
MHKASAVRIALASIILCIAAVAAVRGQLVIEQVLVKVNGEIFTKTDLEARQVATLRQRGLQTDPASDPMGVQLRRALDEITPELIVSVVDEMLAVQRGRELGYQLGDEQFQSVLENIKRDNNLKSDEELQAALKQENMSLADLRKNVERSMIVSRVQQTEVLGRIAVSEDEARRYYDSHVNEFTTPQTVTLREIFVAVPDEGTAADAAARQKADDIRRRVLAGESFEKLASEASESPSQANAGLIGPLSLDDLVPELRKRLESMKVGEVSELLRGARGYQILKLEASIPAQTTPFAQAREEISDRVFTERRQQELRTYLDRLRSQAIIEWKNAELEKAFQVGLEQVKSAPAPAR